MAQVAIQHPHSPRAWLLIWPREHGAWGILAIPLATGAAVGLLHGGQVVALALFIVAVLALFCMRTPAESLLGTAPVRVQTEAERRAVGFALAGFAAVALVAAYGLLAHGRNTGLLALGLAAAALFILQSVGRKLGRRVRMAAQLIGALGLTSTAAGAYYVVTRHFDLTAFALWFANWIFAGNQIHFVQLRIHGARLATRPEKFAHGRFFFIGQIVMLLLLAAGSRFGLLPRLAIVAFVPVFVRGLWWFFRRAEPLRVHRLGVTELAHALAFGALLIASFYWA